MREAGGCEEVYWITGEAQCVKVYKLSPGTVLLWKLKWRNSSGTVLCKETVLVL